MKPGTRVTFPCQIEAGGFVTCIQGGREHTLYDSASNPIRAEHFKPGEATVVESDGRTLWVDPTGSYMEMWDPEMCIDGDVVVAHDGTRRLYHDNSKYLGDRGRYTVADMKSGEYACLAVLRKVPQNT